MATATELQQLYVAYFGRPADPAGLDYWVRSGISTQAFAAQMFAQPEFQSVNSGLSVEAQVNQIYLNLFGRSADSAGLLYWTQQINAGRLQLASIANDLIYACNQGAASAADIAALANKTSTANTYTTDLAANASALLAYQPQSTNPWVSGTNFATAVSFMNTATATNAPTSAQIAASVATIAANGAPGQTITLTTDRFSYVGGPGNDTFIGGLAAGGVQTLLSNDSIDGGGGNNSLIATLNQNVSPASIRNVQTVEISSVTAPVVLNLVGATGVTTFKNTGSSQALTVQGISQSVALQLLNTNQAFTVALNDVTGSADTSSLTVSGVTGGVTTIEGVETLGLTSSGGVANTIAGITDAALTTLNVAGNTALTVTAALGATVATVNASSSTGGVTLNAANGNIVFTGSAGNDIFTVNAAGNASLNGGIGNDILAFAPAVLAFTANDTVVGGAGTNSLRIGSADATIVSTATTTNVSGINTLQISDAAAQVTVTTANLQAGINQVDLRAGTAIGATTLTLEAGTKTVTVGADNAGALTTALTVNDTGIAIVDVLNLQNAMTAGAVDGFGNQALTINGFETVNINTGSVVTAAQDTAAITINADATGTAVLNISGVNSFGSNAGAIGAITAGTVNASGLTGTAALVMGAASVGVTAITGSGNADTLIGSATATSINGGAGNDAITGGAGNDTFVGGDGNDTITAAAGNDNLSGGAGDDVAIFGVAGDLTLADTVDGGTGTNSLNALNADLVTLSSAARTTFTNLQTLNIIDQANGSITLPNIASSLTTANLVNAANAALTAGATSLTGGAGTFTVGVGSNLAVGNARVLANALTVVDTGTANTDVLVISNNAKNAGATINGFNGQNLTSTGYETVRLSSGDTANAVATTIGTLAITADAATANTALTLTGLNAINITAITTNSTGLLTIDASGITNDNSAALLTIGGTTSGAGGTQSITGSTGNDTITVGNFAATIRAGLGADTLVGGSAADSILGEAGNDQITSNGGNDTLFGGDGNDTITAGVGTQNINGDAGDDRVVMAGNLTDGDTVSGGTGTDTYVTSAPILANYAGVTEFEIIEFSAAVTQNMSRYTGTTFTRADMAAAAALTLTGASASLTELRLINGSTASFALNTSTAADTLTIGAQTNANTTAATLTVNDIETLNVNAGAITTAGNAFTIGGLDAIQASTINISGVQNTSLTFAANGAATGTGSTARTITVAAGNSAGTVVFNGATALATQALAVTGSASAANTITGGAGADTITGGSGNDSITGGAGADTISLGIGTDTIYYSAASQTATVTAFGAQTITTADIVTGMGAADIWRLLGAATTNIAYTGDAAVAADNLFVRAVNVAGLAGAGTLVDNGAALERGNYNTLTGAWTQSATGSDLLFVYDQNATATATAYQGIILSGSGGVITGAGAAAFAAANVQITFT